VTLEKTHHPLKVRLVDDSQANEILLKLINLQGPSETENLKEKLQTTERESDVLTKTETIEAYKDAPSNTEKGKALISKPSTQARFTR